MNEAVKYEAKYNKQIAEFDKELAKELKAGIKMEEGTALVILAQEKVMAAGYLTYGGKFMGKKGERHDYDAHVAWREDADVLDYSYLLVKLSGELKRIAEERKQLAELRLFIDASYAECFDKLYQMSYGFGDAWVEMERKSSRAGLELNPKCEEEEAYAVNVCEGEKEFKEFLKFYGREDLRESIENKLTLGGKIYLGRLNGKIVCAAVACPRETVEISELYTAEDFRLNYYAHDLLACIIKDFRAKRKKEFTMRVKASNYVAVGLLQSLSFRLSKPIAEMFRLSEL